MIENKEERIEMILDAVRHTLEREGTDFGFHVKYETYVAEDLVLRNRVKITLDRDQWANKYLQNGKL